MLTLDEVKDHCRIEAEFKDEDVWLAKRIVAAQRYVENFTDRRFGADENQLEYDEVIGTAMLMLIEHWYNNRSAEVDRRSADSVTFAVGSLLQPYRSYGV